ncbi:hypothetical protein M7784_05640 [Desulfovibrio aminophilus]|nr:hypothetical protein [Desulfovibrio aminophilus]MCM0754726.1 hypothetical protein [Desulfovibrio aminophilus]
MSEGLKTILGIEPSAAGGTTTSASSVAQRFPDPRPASLRRLDPGPAREYRDRVQTLSSRLAAFSWPDSGWAPDRARLVVADPGLDGKLAASLPDASRARPYERFVSRGFDPEAASALDPGTYSFEMTLDGTTEKLSVEVAAGDTNRDVLGKVADAVNDADLPAQSRVVFQSAPGQHLENSLATGLSLTLDLNQARDAGELALRDTSGHLLDSLNLAAVPAPQGPAETGACQVLGERAATATSYVSKTLDPTAVTDIAPGTYALDWSAGPDSGSAEFQVNAGDSWDDVLQNLSSALNMTQQRFTAETAARDRTVYTEDGRALPAEGELLSLSDRNPKLGQRLVISGADDASSAALAALGLSATARPGTDGEMRVDAATQIRRPGTFEADQGRLRLDLAEPFGETLPLRVTDALEVMEKGLGDTLTAYNDLRGLIQSDEARFQPGLAEQWREPVRDAQTGLSWLGLRETGADKQLWLDADAFYAALGQAPDTARDLLSGENGLLTRWSGMAAEELRGDPTRFLAPDTSVPPGAPQAVSELELDLGRRLLDLYETPAAPSGADYSPSGRLVDEKG